MFWEKPRWEADINEKFIKDTNLIEFNKKLSEVGIENIRYIKFKNNNLTILVDVSNASICVNGNLVVKKDKVCEIVNFRRKKLQISFSGEIKEEIEGYGIGFKEKNKKIYVFVRNNKYEIVEE